MGRKGKWFGAVKKVFSPESKEKRSAEPKSPSQKKKWGFGKSKLTHHSASTPDIGNAPPGTSSPPEPAEEIELTEAENEQDKHAYSMALATAAAAEAAIAAAQAAAVVVRLTSNTTRFAGKLAEEIAAIKIQTAFRGYLARRALRALKGLVRLKSLVHGDNVKRQATTTLRCMQTLSRVQSQIRDRRIRMTEENQALQRQLQLKRERELEALRAAMGDQWDDSPQSKDQIEASIVNKHEAAIKRERALAYAYSHQWKSSSRSVNPMFTDPNNPNWGWSWLERWMASRPWESRSLTEKESNGNTSVKSANSNIGGEIAKSYARRDINMEKPSPGAKTGRPASRMSPSTPQSVTGKMKPASPGGRWGPPDDDTRSMLSLQSEWHRRHSLAGSSVRDDESLASTASVPSYMTPTECARNKSRFQSPSTDNLGTPDRGSTGPVKKRLSFPAADKNGMMSPASMRRHSGPPKVSVGISSAVTSNGGSR